MVSPAAGSVVRVRLAPPTGDRSGPDMVTGTVIAASAEEVVVLPGIDEAPVVLSREVITGIDMKVSPGRRNRGALVGAAAGAIAGLIAGTVADDNSGSDLFAPSVLESGPMLALLAAPVGAAIGALVAPGEQWQELSSADLRIGYGMTAGAGIGFHVALKF